MSDYSAEKAVIDAALDAAKIAANSVLEQMGGDWSTCGYSWVVVPEGRSRMARALKLYADGGRASPRRGIEVWNPSKTRAQSIDVAEAGSRAFAKVLRDAGYSATAHSRVD